MLVFMRERRESVCVFVCARVCACDVERARPSGESPAWTLPKNTSSGGRIRGHPHHAHYSE